MMWSSKRNSILKIYGWIYLVQAGTNYFSVDSDFDKFAAEEEHGIAKQSLID